jgi:hypothetical protein
LVLIGNWLVRQVGWIKASDQTILTLHKRVITHNTRIHVTHDEHNTWNLHIKVMLCNSADGIYHLQHCL